MLELIVLVVDLSLPLEWGCQNFYFIPIFLAALLTTTKKGSLRLGAVSATFIMLVFLLRGHEQNFFSVLSNRLISVSLILSWTVVANNFRTLLERSHWLEQKSSAAIRTLTVREQEKAVMIQELKRSNQELDDFAYIASHDLKEPLRGISNHVRFLEEDCRDKLDEGDLNRLKRMSYLSHRMEALINDLLYFSRLGRQKLAFQKVSVAAMVREIESMIDFTLLKKKVVVEVSELMPEVTCDVPRIKEVFRNLITNALKYNDKPEVRIEIGFKPSERVNNEFIENVFYVKDNGIGIEKEFHEDIFKIFKRLNDEDDATKGTGVGLTFVKKIIERHGGRIWVDSALGKGTTFYFNVGDNHNESI